MGTLVLEPMTTLERKLHAERARLDTFLRARGTVETEYARKTAADASDWTRQEIDDLERARLASLRKEKFNE
jgi:DNA-binding FadR family transcriptional regulator